MRATTAAPETRWFVSYDVLVINDESNSDTIELEVWEDSEWLRPRRVAGSSFRNTTAEVSRRLRVVCRAQPNRIVQAKDDLGAVVLMSARRAELVVPSPTTVFAMRFAMLRVASGSRDFIGFDNIRIETAVDVQQSTSAASSSAGAVVPSSSTATVGVTTQQQQQQQTTSRMLPKSDKEEDGNQLVVIVGAAAGAVVLLLLCVVFFLLKRRSNNGSQRWVSCLFVMQF